MAETRRETKPENPPKPPLKKPHMTSPQRARVRTLAKTHSRAEIKKILWEEDKEDWNRSTISRIIKDTSSRRTGHCPEKPETRGRKRKFSEAELARVSETITTSPDMRWMDWKKAIEAADIDLKGGEYAWVTVKRRLMERDGDGKYSAVSKSDRPNVGPETTETQGVTATT